MVMYRAWLGAAGDEITSHLAPHCRKTVQPYPHAWGPRQVPMPALAPLLAGYANMSPAEQAEADFARRRAQLAEHQAAIDAAREADDVVDAVIVPDE